MPWGQPGESLRLRSSGRTTISAASSLAKAWPVRHLPFQPSASPKRRGDGVSSTDEHNKTRKQKQSTSGVGAGTKLGKGPAAGLMSSTPKVTRSAADRRRSQRQQTKRSLNRLAKYEEDEDTESGRTWRCLDNSVALLIKTRTEDMVLKIAVGAIFFVAAGIFILLSFPPATPPKEVVDLLIDRKQ